MLDDERVEGRLPGRQGRELLALLVVRRHGALTREQLVDELWEGRPPAAVDSALSALLSKLRRLLGPELLRPGTEPRLALPPGAHVDLEAALEGIHRAESAVAAERWTDAWGPARVALHTANRGFLPGHESAWIEATRRELEDVRIRALESVARTGLALGGEELPAAERAAAELVRAAPFRESGYRLRMETLEARGDPAEALRVYDVLRRLLRDELGVSPSAEAQRHHERLLSSAS